MRPARQKNILFKLFGIGFMVCILFLSYLNISFAAPVNIPENNIEEILAKLPYKINFSEAELKLLKTLSPTDLEKIIKIATLVKQQALEKSRILNNQVLAEQARMKAQNNPNNSTNPNSQNQNNSANPASQQKPTLLDTLFGKQPTATSPFQSPTTPFYNPATGQFQNTPSSNGGVLGGLLNSGAISQISGGPATSGRTAPGRQGSPSKCAGPNMKHLDAIKKLNEAGIRTPNTSTSFDGLPEGTILMAKKIKEECSCDVAITSATRSFGSTATARPNSHYVGNMVVDFAYDQKLSNYIRSKGGNVCRPSFNGIKFIDEGKCPIAGISQGAHWHVDARNWDCN